MKKLLCMILATLMLLSLFACGNKPAENNDEALTDNSEVAEDVTSPEVEEDAETEEEEPSETPLASEQEEEKPADKPAENPEQKPEAAPAPEQKPEPSPAPEVKPEEKPADKPAENNGKTTGDTMLAIFRANKNKSIEEIANACLADPSIQFMSGTMPVEPGFLAEFGGDVTGFDKAIKFGPMMGSIAFSGFVFEVSGDANAFAKDLASKADPRWNICVEADQTVWEVSGNKVFFLMCPSVLGE